MDQPHDSVKLRSAAHRESITGRALAPARPAALAISPLPGEGESAGSQQPLSDFSSLHGQSAR
jgi:hypothetical protein